MTKILIYVHRFQNRNGVGNSAIVLYNELIAKGHEVEVFCMRSDYKYLNYKNVHKFFLSLPYSLEVILMPLWSFFTKRGNTIIHSFEVALNKCDYYHQHFDLSIKKNHGNKFSFRNILRKNTDFINKLGFLYAIHLKVKIVTPSELLAFTLSTKYPELKKRIIVLPNRLEDIEIENIRRKIAQKNLDIKAFIQSEGRDNEIAIIANGDFWYKGVSQLDKLLSILPKRSNLVIIGGNKNPVEIKLYRERIRWIKALDREDLFSKYLTLKGIVIASSFESFSMVALEAISFGIPTLVMGKIGITKNYLDFISKSSENSVLFNVSSTTSWITAMNSEKNYQLKFNEYLRTERESVLSLKLEGMN